MAIHVNYYLTGYGWSECFVCVDDRSVHLSASYLSDALGDLVRAVIAVLQEATQESECSFTEEPGEFVWRFTKCDESRLRIQIEFYEDWIDLRPDVAHRSVFEAECSLKQFSRAVLAAAEQVFRSHGEAGYLDQWSEHPFPSESVRHLRSLLEISDE